jgi:hypothetical protein
MRRENFLEQSLRMQKILNKISSPETNIHHDRVILYVLYNLVRGKLFLLFLSRRMFPTIKAGYSRYVVPITYTQKQQIYTEIFVLGLF